MLRSIWGFEASRYLVDYRAFIGVNKLNRCVVDMKKIGHGFEGSIGSKTGAANTLKGVLQEILYGKRT